MHYASGHAHAHNVLLVVNKKIFLWPLVALRKWSLTRGGFVWRVYRCMKVGVVNWRWSLYRVVSQRRDYCT